MTPRRAMRLGQLGVLMLVGIALIGAAHGLSRSNTLASFSNYRPDWGDVRRAPVEHLAVEVLGRQLVHPDEDPELTQAALLVLRASHSWGGMAPGICSQLKGWLDVHLERNDEDPDRIKPAFDLLVMAECEDSEAYKTRIAEMAGDRTAQAIVLAKQSATLSAQTAAGRFDDPALDDVANAWQALHAPLNGRPINWLALEVPAIAEAQRDATIAVQARLLALLEPYLAQDRRKANAPVTFGDTLPDEPILAWLDAHAVEVNREHPDLQEKIRRTRAVLARFAPLYYVEPVPEAACTSAMRYHQLTMQGLIIGLGVVLALAAGLWFALIRLRRGPKPVDVDAETMENVEPIDMDTDAETRIRSSANITDVG